VLPNFDTADCTFLVVKRANSEADVSPVCSVSASCSVVPLPQCLHETVPVLFHNLTLSLTCVIIFTVFIFQR
jgi:hypothetical protein